MTPIQDIRQRAWRTRRARYGAKGHAGTYSRQPAHRDALDAMRAMIARLHVEGILSEGQASKACNMGRVVFRLLVDRQYPDYQEQRRRDRGDVAEILRMIRLHRLLDRQRAEVMTDEDWEKLADHCRVVLADSPGWRRRPN